MESVVEDVEPAFDVEDAPEQPGVVLAAGAVLSEEDFGFTREKDVSIFKRPAAENVEDVGFEGTLEPEGKGRGVAFFIGSIDEAVRQQAP